MPKDGEIEYLRSLGEAGRQHAANKPFSDAQCHIFLEDIGAILERVGNATFVPWAMRSKSGERTTWPFCTPV